MAAAVVALSRSVTTTKRNSQPQPQPQPQGPRTGPLGGDCITISPPIEPSTEPAADPTTATAPPSLLEILRQLAPPPAPKGPKAPKTAKGAEPAGFGVSLSPPALAALQQQQNYASRWSDRSWRSYRASNADKLHPDPRFWEMPAYRAQGEPVPSLVAPSPAIHKPEPTDRVEQHKWAATIAANLWSISAAAVLIRKGCLSVGDALLLMKAHGALFKDQGAALTACQKAIPGYRLRWADNGALEIDPEHKLTENDLTRALADRAAADIKAAQAV
jgi:hypothetical protein